MARQTMARSPRSAFFASPAVRRRRAVLFTTFGVLGLLGLSAATFEACIPTYTFGEQADSAPDGASTPPGTDAGGAPDGSTDGTVPPADGSSPLDATPPVDGNPAPPHDGGVDAQSPSDAEAPPASLVSTGTKVFSTGFGYQLHLVFAENDGRFWLFYVDDTTTAIKALASPDLVATWTSGGSVALATGYVLADGNDFSVAYANLGGTDVVHIVANSVSSSRYAIRRATISAGTVWARIPSRSPTPTRTPRPGRAARRARRTDRSRSSVATGASGT